MGSPSDYEPGGSADGNLCTFAQREFPAQLLLTTLARQAHACFVVFRTSMLAFGFKAGIRRVRRALLAARCFRAHDSSPYAAMKRKVSFLRLQ